MVQIVLESLSEGQHFNINRKSEIPGKFDCPKAVEKVNFSPRRPTTLEISDLKP